MNRRRFISCFIDFFHLCTQFVSLLFTRCTNTTLLLHQWRFNIIVIVQVLCNTHVCTLYGAETREFYLYTSNNIVFINIRTMKRVFFFVFPLYAAHSTTNLPARRPNKPSTLVSFLLNYNLISPQKIVGRCAWHVALCVFTVVRVADDNSLKKISSTLFSRFWDFFFKIFTGVRTADFPETCYNRANIERAPTSFPRHRGMRCKWVYYYNNIMLFILRIFFSILRCTQVTGNYCKTRCALLYSIPPTA